MVENSKTLIIEIPYHGMGDHLFHSHIPRIAKESGKYNKVFISNFSLFRHPDNKRIIWELNPFIDGFVNEHGKTCNIERLVNEVSKKMLNTSTNVELNLLDEVMFAYGLNDNKRYHEPEIYFTPQMVKEYKKVVFDPNFFSYIGDVNKADIDSFINSNKIKFDAIMKVHSPKALHETSAKFNYITTPSLEDFCNLIYSCEKLYCFTSGTATLAAALNKSATVFYGKNQHAGFQHSKLHKYVLIDSCLKTKIINILKTPYRFLVNKNHTNIKTKT